MFERRLEMKLKPAYAYTWAIKVNGKYELCNYAMAQSKFLKDEPKPSHDAKIIRVKMTPFKRRKLKK